MHQFARVEKKYEYSFDQKCACEHHLHLHSCIFSLLPYLVGGLVKRLCPDGRLQDLVVPSRQQRLKKNTDLFARKLHDSLVYYTLQRHNTKNSKQIFPEKELLVPSQNFHIHVSVTVSNLYLPMIGLPILLQENMWTEPGNI